MDSFIKNFIKDNKPQVEKYKKYFKDNHWGKPVINRDKNNNIVSSKYYYVNDIKVKEKGTFVLIHEGKSSEYNIQHKITKTVLNRLIYFHKQVEQDVGKNTSIDNMIKKMVDLINYHLRRVDRYIKNSDSLIDKETNENSEKTEKDYRSEDIEFDNTLYKNKAELQDALDKLDLENEKEHNLLELMDDAKAPLAMREQIEREFPHIKEYVDSLGIDFTSLPKNEMFINMDKVPEWNPDKHYFEQDKKTLQFYVDEFKKIRNGIKLNGQHISGWLYTQLNVFKTPIPTEYTNELTGETFIKDKIKNPPLRDNEWFIIQDSYEKARKNDEILFLCATRRAAKTTLISSHLQYKALSGAETLVVAGGSAKDLGHIEKNFKTTMLNAHPAFYLPNISDDWSKTVKLGIKKKNKRDILTASLGIYNLEGGAESKSEILAGLTPDAFVLDECMKSPFKTQLDGLLPAIRAGGKNRCVPILSGTGGSENISEDSLLYLKYPSRYNVCKMDWQALEKRIPKEHVTWRKKDFGTFLPAQMSIEAHDLRTETNLSKYLDLQSKELEKIKILITDWEKTKERFLQRREDVKHDKKSLHKEKVYFPLDPEDILLSGDENPFDKNAVRRHRDRLIEKGDIGKNVTLYYNEQTKKVDYEIVDKEPPEFPFAGGFYDSPVTIFQDPLPNAPFELIISGLDDYKQQQADSESVGSFVLIRQDTEEVVATYHSRPDPHSKFHEQGRLLLELYDAPVFMENEDMDFKEYMDRQELTDEYILKQVDFLGDSNFSTNEKRIYGWTPNGKNKPYLFNIMYKILTKKEDYIDEETGDIRQRYKFERVIKDVRLLNEILNYSKNGNFDGLTALMSAYGYAYYLAITGQAPEKPETEEEKRQKNKVIEYRKKRVRKRGLFPKQRRRGKLW